MRRVLAASLVIWLSWTEAASAHAGEGGEILLLPTQLYIVGGALAVLASFCVLALFHQQPRLARHVTARTLPRWIAQSFSLACLLLLGLLVAAGFFGKPDPLSNPLPMTIWTLWWAGFTLLVAFAGDLWSIVNPWSGLYRLLGRRPALPCPERLGYLPAILLFLGFAWFELVYPAPEDPARLALVVAMYWASNFIALLLFGWRWLERGEAFSVFFAIVGMLSPISWKRRGEAVAVAIGRPGSNLVHSPIADLTGAVFVLATLASVSFDGLSHTFTWAGWLGVNPLEYPGRSAVLWQNTGGLILSVLVLAGLYAAAIALGPRKAGFQAPFRLFVGSIVPISIAYHLAHYLPSLIVEFPTAMLALADPFGLGWSLFPHDALHAGTGVGLGADGVVAIYRVQTALIVGGHVMAVLTAHRIALQQMESHKKAVVSQIPLTGLMVAYTLFGLWLLSTPEIG